MLGSVGVTPGEPVRCFFQWNGGAARIAIDSARHVDYIYLTAYFLDRWVFFEHPTRAMSDEFE
jgi:hypothetical protein